MYGTKPHAASCNRQRSKRRASPRRREGLIRAGLRCSRVVADTARSRALVTPWDIGELTKPFIFLDYAEVAPGAPAPFFVSADTPTPRP